jgi:hypothetical protein
VKPADCGVASLADTSGIGCATLLAFGRFDLTQIMSKVTTASKVHWLRRPFREM